MKLRMVSVMACLVLVAGMLTGHRLEAQSTASITGEVRDSSGAVVPAAKIEVLNINTGQKRETETSTEGAYVVTNLPPGSYRVTVSGSGFATQVRQVSLLVGTSPELDFTLSPATVAQTVEVQAATPLVETNTATVHQVITPEQVDTLPINGRDFQTLASLVPGVTSAQLSTEKNYDPVKRNVPAISINGQSGRNLYMTLDGGDNTDIFMGGQNITLSLESVQEFEVITHDPKAQVPRGIGGIINVVTKSGTNRFHGSAFGFFRDDSLQSIDAISDMLGSEKPPFDSQQFGGTVGGPIVPDRAFFFYSYERQQKDTSRVFNSGGAFPNLDGTVTPQPFRQNFHVARFDSQLTPHHSFFVRYAEQDNDSQNEFFSDTDTPESSADETNRLHDLVAGWTALVGNNKVNDLRFHYQFFSNDIQNDPSSLTTPTIILPGATFGASQAGSQAPTENMYQVTNDFSWTTGRHTFRFGGQIVVQPDVGIVGDFRHNRYLFANNDYDPTTNTVGPTNTLLNFRSWSSPRFDIDNRTLTQIGFYAQDDIRLGRLTLALGLRWDAVLNLFYNRGTVPEERTRVAVTQGIPGAPSQLFPADDMNNFAPRAAFAYDLFGTGRTVLRGGYSRIYDPSSILASTLFADLEVTQLDGSPPFDFVFVPGAFVGFFGIPCDTVPCQPAAVDLTGFTDTFPIGFVNSPDMVVAQADQFTAGFSHQLEGGPLDGLTFDVDAVYSHTRKLTQGRNLNFCLDLANDPNCTQVNFPDAGTIGFGFPRQIFLEDTTGRNDYTGFMFAARKRFANRWQLLAHYTVSRAVTDTNQFTFVVLNQLDPHALGELGPSEFDERHRAVISGSVLLPFDIQFSTIFQAASARPYTPASNQDLNMDGVPSVFGAITNGPAGSRTFNVAEGDRAGGRGTLRGDETFSWDIRASKIFRFGESMRLEGLFEVFNLTNAANFGNNFFDNVDDPARFGDPINIVTPPRTAQIGVRFSF